MRLLITSAKVSAASLARPVVDGSFFMQVSQATHDRSIAGTRSSGLHRFSIYCLEQLEISAMIPTERSMTHLTAKGTRQLLLNLDVHVTANRQRKLGHKVQNPSNNHHVEEHLQVSMGE